MFHVLSQLKSKVFSWPETLPMSAVEEFPEMDADLLGLLFQAESDGADDPFFSDGSVLMEGLFSEQDVSTPDRYRIRFQFGFSSVLYYFHGAPLVAAKIKK